MSDTRLTPEREAEMRRRHRASQEALDEQPLARALSSPFGLAAHDDRGALLAALDAERARNATLEATFRHIHQAQYVGEVLTRACGRCGLDLTDAVHERQVGAP